MSHSVQQQLANSTNNRNVVHTLASGSSVGFQSSGNGTWNFNRDQAIALQESYDTVLVNPYSVPAQSALQQGSAVAYVDFQLPSTLGQIKSLYTDVTLHNGSESAWVPECPLMPFSIHHVEVWQAGAQIGQNIPALALWKYYGYVNTLNEMKQLQARSTIDAHSYALTCSSNLGAGASRVYSIDWAPMIQFIQAKISVKYCSQITLRFYFESIANIAPSNANDNNNAITLTSFILRVTQLHLDADAESKMAAAYQKNVDGRCLQIVEERGSFVSSAGNSVTYNTNAFNNVTCALVDVSLRSTNPSGANMITFNQATSIDIRDQNSVSLINGIVPTSSDYLDIYYPEIFDDNIFTKASGLYIYPVLRGSIHMKQTLKRCQQLGYRVFPNRCQLLITMPSSATYQLVIHAWTYAHCRVQQGKIAVY